VCGILAVVGRRLPDDARFEQALDLLAHRGPDDAGRVRYDQALLGNRRLSILDLSPAGHQPFVDEETGVALTYNGEVFNYVELRRELE
jgi:asparagine synthase (glutamine-hydrolysing)